MNRRQLINTVKSHLTSCRIITHRVIQEARKEVLLDPSRCPNISSVLADPPVYLMRELVTVDKLLTDVMQYLKYTERYFPEEISRVTRMIAHYSHSALRLAGAEV